MSAAKRPHGTHFAPPGEVSLAKAQKLGEEEPSATPPTQVHKVSVGRSSAIMAAGTLISRLLGFIKVALIGLAIGATANVSDIFETANNLPNQLYIMLAGGVFNVVLVPQIIKASKRPDRGADYLSRLLTLGAIFLVSVTVLLTVFSGPVIRLLTDNWTSEQVGLGAQFSIWLMPQILFYGMYALLGQALNANDRFGAYMWAPVVNNIVAIMGLLVFIGVYGSGGHVLGNWTSGQTILLAGTTTLGVVIQAIALIWPMRALGLKLRPKFGWRGMGLRASGKIAGWALATMVIGQLSFLFISRVATGATASKPDSGSQDWPGIFVFSRASDIYLLPHSIIVLSIATVLFNQMARASQAHDKAALRDSVSRLFRTVGVATMFAGAGLFVISGQLGYLLGGESRPDGHALGIAIAILALSSPFLSLHFMANRVFYAQEDARWPFILQAVLVVFGVGTAIIVSFFPPSILIYALVATEALGNVIGPILSLSVLHRRIGGFEFPRVLRAHVQFLAAALLSAVIGTLVLTGLGGLSYINGSYSGYAWSSHPAAIVTIIVVGSFMAASYALALWLMRVQEFTDLIAPLVSKLSGRIPLARTLSARLERHQIGSNDQLGLGTHSTDHPRFQEDAMASPVEVGSVLGGRYRINTHILVSAEGDHVLEGTDEVLNRPVSIILTGDTNAEALEQGARELATDVRSAPFQILDLGKGKNYTYLVTSHAPAPDLLDLLIPSEPFVEPNFTDALGLEIFGTARPATRPGEYEYVYEDNSPLTGSQARPRGPFDQEAAADSPAQKPTAEPNDGVISAQRPQPAVPQQPSVSPQSAKVSASLPVEPEATVGADSTPNERQASFFPSKAKSDGVYMGATGTSVQRPAPAESEPEYDEDSRNAPKSGRWLVGGVLLLLLVVAIVIAVSQLGRIQAPTASNNSASQASQATQGGSGSTSTASQTPSAQPIPVAATCLVSGSDSQTSCGTDGANLKNLIDGNPATSWTSYQFATAEYGRLAKSVALVVELKDASTFSSVTISQLGATGGNFQILTNSSPSLDGAVQVGTGSFTGTDITVGVTTDSAAKYVLVNFTELPRLTNPNPPQFPFGLKVSEIAIK